MLAVIGGSGLYGLGKNYTEEQVITPYGDAKLFRYKLNKDEFFFIPRHKKDHSLPPHKVNYRANIFALNKLGVTAALGVYAAGIISKYKPGDLIILNDFIGLESPITFYNSFSAGMKHFDFTNPFDKKLIEYLKESASIHRIKLKEKGIVKCTYGPRFETKAEIKMYKKLGANLVNMTSGHEIVLMKEMEIPFVGLSVGTNYACGVSKKPLSTEEVLEMMEKKNNEIGLLVKEFVKFIKV